MTPGPWWLTLAALAIAILTNQNHGKLKIFETTRPNYRKWCWLVMLKTRSMTHFLPFFRHFLWLTKSSDPLALGGFHRPLRVFPPWIALPFRPQTLQSSGRKRRWVQRMSGLWTLQHFKQKSHLCSIVAGFHFHCQFRKYLGLFFFSHAGWRVKHWEFWIETWDHHRQHMENNMSTLIYCFVWKDGKGWPSKVHLNSWLCFSDTWKHISTHPPRMRKTISWKISRIALWLVVSKQLNILFPFADCEFQVRTPNC